MRERRRKQCEWSGEKEVEGYRARELVARGMIGCDACERRMEQSMSLHCLPALSIRSPLTIRTRSLQASYRQSTERK